MVAPQISTMVVPLISTRGSLPHVACNTLSVPQLTEFVSTKVEVEPEP